jgi:hypothetical protein
VQLDKGIEMTVVGAIDFISEYLMVIVMLL